MNYPGLTPAQVDELLSQGVVLVPDLPDAPIPDAPTAIEASDPAPPALHTFIFTADFTGKLGSLGIYRFNPMVPVIKGERYEVAMNPGTGATTVTQLPPDPFAPVKAESARLYKASKKRQQEHKAARRE